MNSNDLDNLNQNIENSQINSNPVNIPSDLQQESQDILFDSMELAFDSIMNDGLLKDIPIISTAVSFIRLSRGISDYLRLKKLYVFQQNLHTVDDKRREKFLSRIQQDQEFREEVGLNLLLLLEKMEHIKKPILLAKVFSAFVEGKINKYQYERLCFVVDKVDYSTLPHLMMIYSKFKKLPYGSYYSSQAYYSYQEEYDVVGHFMSLGLLTYPDDSSQFESSTFSQTTLGRQFIEIAIS